MEFGLTNDPGKFQLAINILLSSIRWKFEIVYLEDIILFSKTIEDHMTLQNAVLALLKDAGLTLKIRKCLFQQDQVEYLGYIVIHGCLQIA